MVCTSKPWCPLLSSVQVLSGTRAACLLAVESFHASAPHPSKREQTLDEGELLALASAAAPAGAVRWESILEERVQCEDGRPLLLAVLRCTRAGPIPGLLGLPEAASERP